MREISKLEHRWGWLGREDSNLRMSCPPGYRGRRPTVDETLPSWASPVRSLRSEGWFPFGEAKSAEGAIRLPCAEHLPIAAEVLPSVVVDACFANLDHLASMTPAEFPAEPWRRVCSWSLGSLTGPVDIGSVAGVCSAAIQPRGCRERTPSGRIQSSAV